MEKSIRGSFENVVGVSLPEFAQVVDDANKLGEFYKQTYILDQAENCFNLGAFDTALRCLAFFNTSSLGADTVRYEKLFCQCVEGLSSLEVELYGKEEN